MSDRTIISEERATQLRTLVNEAAAKGRRPRDYAQILSSTRLNGFAKGKVRLRQFTADKLEKFLRAGQNGAAATAPAVTPPAANVPLALADTAPHPFTAPQAKPPAADDEHEAEPGYCTTAERATLWAGITELRRKFGSLTKVGKAMGLPKTTLYYVNGHPKITTELALKIRRGLARAGIGAEPTVTPHSPTPRGQLVHLRAQARRAVDTIYSGQRPALARDAGVTTNALSRFLDGGTLHMEEANAVAKALDDQSGVAGGPGSIEELVDIFARMALRYVLQRATTDRKEPGK